jgi:hypothetical protein
VVSVNEAGVASTHTVGARDTSAKPSDSTRGPRGSTRGGGVPEAIVTRVAGLGACDVKQACASAFQPTLGRLLPAERELRAAERDIGYLLRSASTLPPAAARANAPPPLAVPRVPRRRGGRSRSKRRCGELPSKPARHAESIVHCDIPINGIAASSASRSGIISFFVGPTAACLVHLPLRGV